ncbi:class E sortase [Candidatus Gracilibacteria bacterium]|nr:class E sortase [Candidatus Gracilibacteria bacterium]
MSEFKFENLEKKNPLWKDIFMFCLTVVGVWGGTHLILNYDAYAQIVGFEYKTLQTSVISDLEKMRKIEVTAKQPEETKTVELKKVKRSEVSFKIKKLKEKNYAKQVFKNMPVYPSDNRLYIPRIWKNVPLIAVPNHKNWKQLEKNIQNGLQKGVVIHPISKDPGNFGNFFVTGHSSYYAWDNGRFKDVFALLHEVKVGDLVEVYWEGKKYEYKIRESKVVSPTEVSVLNQPKDRAILTLMTCTPVGMNTNRLILIGDLKNN